MNTNTDFKTITPEDFQQILKEINSDPELQNLTLPDDWDDDFKKVILNTLQTS
ncbi:MAG: hypothetical protein ACI4E3_00655 [Candidatus Fimousia sp.]